MLQEDCHAQDESHRRRRARARARRRHNRVRRARRRDQPALLRAKGPRKHYPHSCPPRRRRVAHGGRFHARRRRQHRRVHRHLGSRRHRHDHRALFRRRRFDSDPLHHWPGTPRADAQGRFPSGRHHRDRQAGRKMGDDGARARAGPARVPAGVSRDALRPPRPGADRPAVRCADGRDRVRSGYVRTIAGLQAEGDAQAG